MLFAEQVLEVVRRGGAVFVALTAWAGLGREVTPVVRLLWLALGARSGLGALPGFVLLPARSNLVVLLALLRVRQDFVRLVDAFEPLLRLRLARVHVRMELPRQLTVRGADLLLRSRFRHAQRGVVVLEVHY